MNLDQLYSDEIKSHQAAALLLERREMRKSLSPFIRKAFASVDPGATYLHNWHIDLISEYLEACYKKEIKQLIINMPPRFMKSISVSVAFPAWLLGQDPSEQILCASYSDRLSMKHSVDTRMIIESAWYKALFPNVKLARDQNEKSKFQTTMRGHRIATSVGGSVLGEGGNYIIGDDLMNPKMANSEAYRTTTNDWFDQGWSTRKNNPNTAVEILMMQRLAEDDTTGHALQEGGWEHLIIPQEAEGKTKVYFPSGRIILREDGELLHPERVDAEAIAKIKKRLGSYGYAGQHQQRPSPKGGGRIKMSWFPRYKELPKLWDEIVMSADTAQKPKEINDPSVIQVYGKKHEQWYLIHQWKDRVIYPDLKNMAIAMLNQWKPDAFLIEDKSSGSSLIQELKLVKKYPIIAIEPEADKVTRMDTQTPSLENGIISLPDPQFTDNDWQASIETNLMNFPNPKAWDELDSMSQFLKWLRKREEKPTVRVRVI